MKRQPSAVRRVIVVAVFALIAAACGGSSDDADDERSIDEFEPARQDVSEADPPPEALVSATTTTTSTTTTTTSTTTTTTTEPPVTTTEPPTTSGGGPATPSGNEVAFESGDALTVGTDVQAGLYIAQAEGGFCTWTRTLADGTEENNIYRGQIVIQIRADDQVFEPDPDCGTWQPYAAPAAPATTIGEGHWVVGQQIVPGTYQTDQTEFDFCYWERSNGFGLTADEIIENDIVMEQTTVVIRSGDARFASSGCGTWTLVS